MPVELVPEASQAHKLWSVRLSAIGAGIMGIFAVWPQSALELWGVMPAEVRALLPESFISYIAAFIFVMTAISRVIVQRSVKKE